MSLIILFHNNARMQAFLFWGKEEVQENFRRRKEIKDQTKVDELHS